MHSIIDFKDLPGQTMSHLGYLHGPLQMTGPENRVCNYLALENIYGMLFVRIRPFHKVCKSFA